MRGPTRDAIQPRGREDGSAMIQWETLGKREMREFAGLAEMNRVLPWHGVIQYGAGDVEHCFLGQLYKRCLEKVGGQAVLLASSLWLHFRCII